jgi:hypothetical protein
MGGPARSRRSSVGPFLVRRLLGYGLLSSNWQRRWLTGKDREANVRFQFKCKVCGKTSTGSRNEPRYCCGKKMKSRKQL